MAVDQYLWNETAQYYNAYTTEYCGQESPGPSWSSRKWHRGGQKGEEEGKVALDPNTPGAIMSDSFYAQVCAPDGGSSVSDLMVISHLPGVGLFSRSGHPGKERDKVETSHEG